jgi:UDP-GlcNAc3NAcA epimerase
MTTKVASVVGARPQFVKIATLVRSFQELTRRRGPSIDHIIIHTGQHYDAGLSDIFFDELAIPTATFNLGIGSGRHGQQTGQMLAKLEETLLITRPDIVVTYGDANSTLAATLAAAKLHIPLAHIEAGLRSFNREMPEEINRIVADHVSDLLFAPTPIAMVNLKNEGLGERSVRTGDLMYDSVVFSRGLAAQRSTILERLALRPRHYGVVTIHRAENTNDERRLRNVLSALNEIAETAFPLVFPLHPRTGRILQSLSPPWSPHRRLHVISPVGYLDTLCLIHESRMLLTDSGGLQKEAFFLDCPCITLRDQTEWTETLDGGNILAGADPEAIRRAVATWDTRLSAKPPDFSALVAATFGDGHAADRIRDALMSYVLERVPAGTGHVAVSGEADEGAGAEVDR